jgi:hypothetical protein
MNPKSAGARHKIFYKAIYLALFLNFVFWFAVVARTSVTNGGEIL